MRSYFCFIIFSTLVIFSSCSTDQKPAPKQATQKKQNVKKSQPKKATVSPYWTGIEKQISLSKDEVKSLKNIQNKYKSQIHKLKKQKKYNKNHRTRIESLRGKEVKKLIGAEKFVEYEKFNAAWAKR